MQAEQRQLHRVVGIGRPDQAGGEAAQPRQQQTTQRVEGVVIALLRGQQIPLLGGKLRVLIGG